MKTKKKEKLGKGTADHLMPFGYLFFIFFIFLPQASAEAAAATKIQASYRGFSTRKNLKNQREQNNHIGNNSSNSNEGDNRVDPQEE